MDSTSDKALMIKVKNGDLNKLGLLFERYYRQLFKYFYRMSGDEGLSEDLVQSVFERILKYRSGYTGNGAFKTWIYSIARNAFIDHYRKQKRAGENYEFDEERWHHAEIEHSGLTSQNDRKRLMEKAIQLLDNDKREVLIMSRFEGLKYKEIAEITNTTEGNIKVKVFRALNELRDLVKKLSEEMNNEKI